VTFPGYPSNRDPGHFRQAPVRPGEELAGKYRVDRVLGTGAMGAVMLAWHIELEQRVAIKFLHPELAANADGAERFRREARAAVRIRNEHVARVLDVGTLESVNIPYIVMEYLHGRDLSRELGARGPLPMGEAVKYLLEACEALAEAHARGIVHRDLKPANLFLAERPSGGKMIKVLDFGISKIIGGTTRGMSITDTATLMGSPGYMSPEQLESSRNVDARTDIWSLGVILYEMVTGVLPFNGDTVPQLVRSVIGGQRTPLVEHDPALSDLEAVVECCLKQDRADRYQSVAALCAALVPFAPGNTGPVYRAPGKSGAAEPARHDNPTLDQAAGHSRSGTGPESAWGRTHGSRRASLRRGIPLAVVLGAAVAFGFWFLRAAAVQTVDAPVVNAPGQATPGVSVGTSHEPTPVSVPSPAPSASDPVAAGNGAAPGSVAGPGAAVTAAPSAETVVPAPSGAPVATPRAAPAASSAAAAKESAAAKPPAPLPAPALAPPQSAALERLPRPLPASGAAPAASASGSVGSTLGLSPAAPRNGAARTAEPSSPGPAVGGSPYEIPEFGGRE
jgi:eukaryotic-like serine/threonine-protein kinase